MRANRRNRFWRTCGGVWDSECLSASEFSRRARADIDQIAWIGSRSRPGADAWLVALDRILESIASAPKSHSLAEEYDPDEFDFELRQALFKTRRGLVYRVLFAALQDKAHVLRVRGPGQASVTPDVDI